MAFPIGLAITAGTSLIGGLSNLLSSQEARREEERRLGRARNILMESMISDSELDRLLRNADRLFNNRLVSTLNTTALRSRGVANREVVGAQVSGQIEAQRLQTTAGIEQSAMEYNRGVKGQLSQLELAGNTYPSGAESFFGGVFGALPAGIELGKFAEPKVMPETGKVPQVQNTVDYSITNTLQGKMPTGFGGTVNNRFSDDLEFYKGLYK